MFFQNDSSFYICSYRNVLLIKVFYPHEAPTYMDSGVCSIHQKQQWSEEAFIDFVR